MTAALGLAAGSLMLPDPGIPAMELNNLRPQELRRKSVQFAEYASGLTAGAAACRSAVAFVGRGWSAPEPGVALTRTLVAAEQSASALRAEGDALDTVASVIEQAKATGANDIIVAGRLITAAVVAARAGSPLGVLTGSVDAARAINLLEQQLRGHLRTVATAVATLTAALAVDPLTGPDGLRAGPTALLPPDPVQNPANRADARNQAALNADLQSKDPYTRSFAMSIRASQMKAVARGGSAQLLIYDPSAFGGQGRAAISVGDLTTASTVAVLVPGIGNTPTSMGDGITAAADLMDATNAKTPGAKTAVIAWYGYDIPASGDRNTSLPAKILDTVAAASATNARAGGAILAADVAAFALMAPRSGRTTLLGFSMGATTVSEAASLGAKVDSVVLLGSPGAGWDAKTVADYKAVDPGQVFVVSYDQDPVTLTTVDGVAGAASFSTNPYGPDPAGAAFGAQQVAASTNVAPLPGPGVLAAITCFPLFQAWALFKAATVVAGDPRNHNLPNYMKGTALNAEASIVSGQTADVSTKPGR